MKKYFGPIALAVLVNIIILAGIMYASIKINKKVPAKQAPQANLTKLVQQINKRSKGQDISKSWLVGHYGHDINVDRTFSAGDNLKGYVVSLKTNPEDHSIIYSVNNGQYFIMGSIIDKSGANISAMNAEKYIDSKQDKRIYEAAQNLSGIEQGDKSAPEAIVIVDPNSNLFPRLWHTFLTDTAQGVFRIKWVMLNYIKPMGPNVAGNVLQAKDKLSALNINAKNYDALTQTGGYQKNSTASKAIQQQLQKNWSFVQKFNLYQLPITIARNKNKYYVLHGAVMDETLEQIFAGD